MLGRAGFWGKQHERRALTDYERLIREHDAFTAAQATGADVSPKPIPATIRIYQPCAGGVGAGGLAQQCGRSVRTIGRWANVFRRAGILGCNQPPANAPDATRSSASPYAYPQWRLLRSPPPGLIRAIERLHGMPPRALERPPAPREPTIAPRHDPVSRTGPPGHAPDDEDIDQGISELRAMHGL